MHNLCHSSKSILSVLALLLACRGASAQEAFEGWHLEPGVGQAHLVMVARVASVSRVTVVEGAKTDVALREYRFQPVRLLKGIFQRDQLSMTAADLGLAAENASSAPPLKEGEFRLLTLAQQRGFALNGGIPSYGCVSAAPGATTFDQRVPLLTGPDDSLAAVVETLIQVADSRSRRERVMLLVERLPEADGVSAVPLLSSLRLRADWAAADERAFAGRHTKTWENQDVHAVVPVSSMNRSVAFEVPTSNPANNREPFGAWPIFNSFAVEVLS